MRGPSASGPSARVSTTEIPAAPIGLLAATPIASLLFDATGRLTWCNEAARLLFDLGIDAGVHREKGRADIGQPHITDLFLDLESDPVRAQFRYVLDPSLLGSTRFAGTLRRHDRRTTPVDLHLVAIDDSTALLQAVDPPPKLERSHLEHQRAFCDAIVRLSTLAQTETEGNEFYRILLQQVIDVVPGAQAGSILVRAPGTDDFSFVAAEGFDLPGLRSTTLTADELHCELTTGAAIIVRELDNSDLPPDKQEWISTVGRAEEIESSVSAPVLVGGEAVAFLNVNNFDDAEAFSTTSLEMTTVFSRLMSDLISRRRIEHDLRIQGESYKHLANHDQLTKLPNRRHIEESMMDIASSSFGTRRPMALLFADLDHFKEINDTYGHDAGDVVLQATAELMQAATRTNDVVGRWGGDEFVVVAPDVISEAHARQLGERILEKCPTRLRLPDGHFVGFTMSIGVAWTDNAGSGVWALLRRADDAVYRAKLAGKGVVRVNTR